MLLSDAAATCPGDAVAAATALDKEGFQTHVIGISISQPADFTALDAIAAAGGTGFAVFVNDWATLCQSFVGVLNDGISCDTLFLNGFE